MHAEVAAGVYRLGDPFVNFYLVVDQGKVTAIDAGLRPHWRQIAPFLQRLGLPTDALEAVVLTHAHVDHVGFAEQARRSTHAAVRIHAADRAVLQRRALGFPPASLRPRDRLRMYWSLLKMRGVPYPRVAEARQFADGDLLDVPGRPRVIHLPGHTAGSCALLLAERDALVSGDALVTVPTAEGEVRALLSPRAFNADNRAALASLARLDGVAARTVLPGHGEPFRGGLAAAVATAREAGIWSLPTRRAAG